MSVGLRSKLAQKYGTIRVPGVFLATGSLAVKRPVVSPSLFQATKVSRDPLRSISFPSSRDFTQRIQLAEPTCIQLNTCIGVPDIRQRPDLLEMAVGITENLLKPIGKPCAEGKDYARSKGLAAISLFGEVEKSGAAYGGRKAYKEKKSPTGILRHTVSLWDMILPLLKPPLVLDFPTQLDLPDSLRPYQVPGIQHLVENPSFLLADDMGTGKTVMACVAMRMLFHTGRIKKALVVCPANAIAVWDEHLEKWGGPALTCTVVRGLADSRASDWKYPAHVYVTTYHTLRNDVVGDDPLLSEADLARFGLVIADEAHHIRNPGAGISKAVHALRPQYRWALTGTPIQNSVEDLVSIFRFVKPGLLPYAPPSSDDVKKTIAPYFLRRRKKDVLPELPEKIRQDIWLDMDQDQQQAYNEVLGRERASFKSGKVPVTRMHIFALIEKLKQICNFAPGKDSSPKLECLLDQIDEVATENKVCVFTLYRGEGVDKLRPHLESYGVVEIVGGMSDAERKQAVVRFQKKDDDVRVFLGTTRAAGEGITLTEGNYVFHFDHWWNPAVAWQAEDRVHRIGQKKKTVNVYYYWMKGTYEERIYDILEKKGLLHAEIIEGLSEADIDQTVSIEEWCKVLGLDVTTLSDKDAKGGRGPLPQIGEVYTWVNSISPGRFEGIVAEVFCAMGYPKVRVTGQSHDGGIDVRAERAALGSTERIVIQCKRKNQVGVEAARDLLGAVSADPRISKGYLVCSGTLSQTCKDFITEHGRLAFLDGVELAKRIIELKIPLKDS